MLTRSPRLLCKAEERAKVLKLLAQRKANWVDRRNHKPRNGGREVWVKEDQPACVLCDVRFRFKQDYQTHKETELHKSRVRWQEMTEWYNSRGLELKERQDAALWASFKADVIVPEAEAKMIPISTAALSHRRALVKESAQYSAGADYPPIRSEITEPRDQRWPASPKH